MSGLLILVGRLVMNHHIITSSQRGPRSSISPMATPSAQITVPSHVTQVPTRASISQMRPSMRLSKILIDAIRISRPIIQQTRTHQPMDSPSIKINAITIAQAQTTLSRLMSNYTCSLKTKMAATKSKSYVMSELQKLLQCLDKIAISRRRRLCLLRHQYQSQVQSP